MSVQLLFVKLHLLIQVVFNDIANLFIVYSCNPPSLEGCSKISFLYFASFPLHRKSLVISSYSSIYFPDGLGRDSRICVIMLETMLLNTDTFPCIVNFLLFHCLNISFIFGSYCSYCLLYVLDLLN